MQIVTRKNNKNVVMMSEEALFAALVEEHAAAAERANEDGIYRDMIKAQLQSENWKI